MQVCGAGGAYRSGAGWGMMADMTETPHPLYAAHAETLTRALHAITERGYWSAFPESPSPRVYGETAAAEGEAAFQAYLGTDFPLDQPGTRDRVATEPARLATEPARLTTEPTGAPTTEPPGPPAAESVDPVRPPAAEPVDPVGPPSGRAADAGARRPHSSQ